MNKDCFFITIGWQHSNIPMGNKMSVYVDTDITTPVKVAKQMRKNFADNAENHGYVKGTTFKPSELFYAIYENVDDVCPIFFSKNTPHIFTGTE